jgi:hypothetical protein
MTLPTPEEVWSTLVCMAETICAKIEEYQPEVVLVMYKSGSVIWRAVETWWRMTRRSPLPSIVGANIGPSKFGAYEAEGYEWNTLEHADWIDVGHQIAWVVRHDDWLEALKRRITAGSGLESPGSFLIVDDVIAEGRTMVIVKSLLWALYPKAQTPMVAGMHWFWREALGGAWLRELKPYPMPPIHDGWVETEFLRKHHIRAGPGTGFPWRQLISGLASNDFAPFGWTPLQPPHPVLTHLSKYLPVDVWLQFPHWVATTTTRMLERQLKSEMNPLDTPPIIHSQPWQPRCVVEPQAFVCALAWNQPWVSLEEAARRCNVSQNDIRDMVADCARWDYLVAAEVEGIAGYSLGPDVEPRML